MLHAVTEKLKKINHPVIMALCCALPIIGFLLLPLMGFSESAGYYLLFLTCPIVHIFMIKSGHSCHNKQSSDPVPKLIEYKEPK